MFCFSSEVALTWWRNLERLRTQRRWPLSPVSSRLLTSSSFSLSVVSMSNGGAVLKFQDCGIKFVGMLVTNWKTILMDNNNAGWNCNYYIYCRYCLYYYSCCHKEWQWVTLKIKLLKCMQERFLWIATAWTT